MAARQVCEFHGVNLQILLLSTAVASAPLGAAPSTLRRALTGGEIDGAHPAIGRVTLGGLLPLGTCTGTLIAGDLVLTAAHCVDSAGSLGFEVTDPDDGTTTLRRFGVRAALAHPGYAPSDAEAQGVTPDDIGLLVLDEEVPADLAEPLGLHRGALGEDVVGTSVQAWGYGQTRTEGSGTKRSAELWVGALFDGAYLLVPDDPRAEGGGTVTADRGLCPGDSGGPDLLDDGGGPRVLGVHALGLANCNLAQSTRLDLHLDAFIDPALAGRAPDGCRGETLADAVCNEALERGCSAGAGGLPSWALLAGLGLAARRRVSAKRACAAAEPRRCERAGPRRAR